MLIPLIMSGGAGTRLWPVSRKAHPKPFIKLADGETLAHKTFQRAAGLTDQNAVWTITGRDHYFLTKDEYQKTEFSDLEQAFLLEPMGRNTAPAIAMAALAIREKYGDSAIMLVMPADHLIEDQQSFSECVNKAKVLAEQGYLVTFGLFPLQPETGFGYIKTGDKIDQLGRKVAEFVEKPDFETAKKYVKDGNYFWNSGMFAMRASLVLSELEQNAPDVYKAALNCWDKTTKGDNPIEFDADSFTQLPDISIDYALMERSSRVAMVEGRFDWNDIGSWLAMSELADSDDNGNRIKGRAIMVDCEQNYVQSENRLIAGVGIKDIVVIDTEDAVLVAHKDRVQDVKSVVAQLKLEKDEMVDFHRTVCRPWGSFCVLQDEPLFKVKRLVVKPAQVLSLQRHQRRSEHWTVVEGVAKVRVGDDEFLLKANESTYVPVQTMHRLENPTDEDITLIEVQCGDYLGEDDIERFEDVYGRVK
ncbi:MAG: mannose-1-phosphate guanylyltransferase/mannose-6-phosphate isomerase [bacterium]